MADKKEFDEDLIGTMGVNHSRGTRRGKRNNEDLGADEPETVIKARAERMRGKRNERGV